MGQRRLTMDWDSLRDPDDEDDQFFESYHSSSGSDDDDDDSDSFEDSRMSFSSTGRMSFSSTVDASEKFCQFKAASMSPMAEDYNMWMEEPGSIKDRRKRLLQGMGLTSNRSFALSSKSLKNIISISKKHDEVQEETETTKSNLLKPPSSPKQKPTTNTPLKGIILEEIKRASKVKSTETVVVQSQSEDESELLSWKKRSEELIKEDTKTKLTRTYSMNTIVSLSQNLNFPRSSPGRTVRKHRRSSRSTMSDEKFPSDVISDDANGRVFVIKNMATGKEYVVQDYNEDGNWNKVNDIETGKQLSPEEFEMSVGYWPIVKNMTQSTDASEDNDDGRKITPNNNNYFQKRLRASKRRGSAFLKNIKGSMSGLIGEKERENNSPKDFKNSASSQWVKARQHSKPFKELTALHMCQEIPAHEGSIWTLRFSPNAMHLASAGVDTVIHVWEVQQCEVAPTRASDDLNASIRSRSRNGSDHLPPAEITPLPSRKKGKINSMKKKTNNSVPYYVNVPETVFTLIEIPVCSFRGHQDDILDLSWSKDQQLLSSSMDKTVRLWDMETKSCLKMFAHNDYVTCIQFNPVDSDEFISGSLDSKVRIWSILDRQVVDWTDLNEMVTAAAYTPDGRGAIVGSHKGICRFYDTSGGKLEQKDQIELRSRKKKVMPKKVTGIQFSPGNPSEVLITSADSRLRILDGSQLVHKFRGVRNTSSQIMASFTPDGKYVMSPSEDSQVYMWRNDERTTKKEDPRGTNRKLWATTHSHEHFQCRDVSVAIPWPGSIYTEPPIVQMHSKRHSKRSIQQSLSTSFQEVGKSKKLPPLPIKKNILERASSCPDEDISKVSRTDSDADLGESCSSTSTSPNKSGFNSPPHQLSRPTVQATAWGLVFVTAGLGGELRVYQNFGLPLKVSRQSNLFRDVT